MPDLLLGGLDLQGRPLEIMAIESVTDGCQLEDFNADVAAACALVCEEPVTRRVLEQIAREERSHADFSWSMLQWLLSRDPKGVRSAIATALAKLADDPRPTAVSSDKQALVAKADSAALRRHGRLPDSEWAAAWDARKSLPSITAATNASSAPCASIMRAEARRARWPVVPDAAVGLRGAAAERDMEFAPTLVSQGGHRAGRLRT
jgi:hypothetical protein